MSDLRPGDDRLKRLETALELVWRIHIRNHVHLGLERGSGVREHCIPCICAAALNRGMDDVTTEHLIETLDAVRNERLGHG